MLKVILPHPSWLDRKDEPIPNFPDGVTVRHMLQTLGTEWGRVSIYQSIWVNIAMRKAKDHLGQRLIIFDDIRFENEVWAIKGLGHRHEILTQIVHISRNAHEPDQKDLHVSEAGLPNYLIDKWVTVDGKGEKTE